MNKLTLLAFISRTNPDAPLRDGSFHPAGMAPFVPVALFAALTGCAPSQPAADQPDGKALYTTYCASCHGADGRNDRKGAAPNMRLAAADRLSNPEWEQLVLTGRGQMPGFQNRLSRAQMGALRAYIRQMTSPP